MMEGAERRFKDLDVIFKEGDTGQTMYVIQDGKVQISKMVSGIMTKIAVLEPGEFIGEMAVIDTKPRAATAIALGRTTLTEYDKQTLSEHMRQDPEIAFKIIETTNKRLRAVLDEFAKLNAKGLLPKEEAQKLNKYTFSSTW